MYEPFWKFNFSYYNLPVCCKPVFSICSDTVLLQELRYCKPAVRVILKHNDFQNNRQERWWKSVCSCILTNKIWKLMKFICYSEMTKLLKQKEMRDPHNHAKNHLKHNQERTKTWWRRAKQRRAACTTSSTNSCINFHTTYGTNSSINSSNYSSANSQTWPKHASTPAIQINLNCEDSTNPQFKWSSNAENLVACNSNSNSQINVTASGSNVKFHI